MTSDAVRWLRGNYYHQDAAEHFLLINEVYHHYRSETTSPIGMEDFTTTLTIAFEAITISGSNVYGVTKFACPIPVQLEQQQQQSPKEEKEDENRPFTYNLRCRRSRRSRRRRSHCHQ